MAALNHLNLINYLNLINHLNRTLLIQNAKRMKKIGILHGKENSFPEAVVERINSKNVKGVHAERALVEELMQGEPTPYAVIFDRISQDVPFYRAYLKNAALNGTDRKSVV